MTKTRKAPAITFRTMHDASLTRFEVTYRLNLETGVEIVPARIAGVRGMRYEVRRPTVGRQSVYLSTQIINWEVVESELTLAEARVVAIAQAEMIREQVAQAYDEAVIEIYDGLQTIEAMVAARADEFPALAATYEAAWHSYDNGFIPAANERLYRVLDHLTGRKLFPSKAESEAALAAAAERLPEHIRVELTFGDRYGMRAMIVGKPFVAAEDGRVCIAVKLSRTGQYRTEYADTLRELVGRPRP